MKTRYHRALCALSCSVLLGACNPIVFVGGSGETGGAGGSDGGAGGSAGSTGGTTTTTGPTGGTGGGGGSGLLPPLDGAFLWLRSDLGLSSDGTQLSWEDQITGQLAIASDGMGVIDSIPAIVPSSVAFNGYPAVDFDGQPNRRIRLPP